MKKIFLVSFLAVFIVGGAALVWRFSKNFGKIGEYVHKIVQQLIGKAAPLFHSSKIKQTIKPHQK